MERTNLASNALTVPTKGGSAVQYVDPSKVDYTMASRWLAGLNQGGGNRTFAGRQLRFNGQKGVYTEYVNKKDVKIKEPTFVLNLPNTMEAWQYWPDKEAPSYPHVISPFSDPNAVLPSRAQCGGEETKYNKLRKEDQDVWSQAIVLVLRNPETDQIYHWVGTGASRWAMSDFLQEIVEEAAKRKGKLPVIELGADETDGPDNSSYMRASFNVVDWVKPTAMDNPQGLAASVASEDTDEDEDDEDAPKATVKSRSSKVSAAKTSKKSRDDDEDDEDDEEEDDAPSTKAAAKKRAAQQAAAKKKYADDEEDEDDEEEDLPRSKKSSKAATTSKRKVVADDDDEDEDEDEDDEDEAPARGRRRGR